LASFWFVSAPLPGHLDWGGYLKTAQALAGAGHTVRWISGPPVARMIAAADLAFLPVDQTGWLWPPPPAPDTVGMLPEEAMRLRYSRALDTWLTADLIIPAVEGLLALAEAEDAPDVLVTDPFLAASAIAAEVLNIPLAVCGWPAQEAPDEAALRPIQTTLAGEANTRIQQMAARFGVEGVNFAGGLTPAVQSPHLHISYFSRYWHQADKGFKPQTHFVGGTPGEPQDPTPAWLDDLEDAPLGLITLGTVFTGDLDFLVQGAQAMSAIGLIPLVVLGRPLPAEEKARLMPALPAGTRLLNWVDFDHVFPRLKVIAHHGGMGTTHAAVVHGVPQVVAPHGADQRGQARRVAQAKVGLNLSPMDVQQGQLAPAIRAVSTDEKVIDTAHKLAAQFAKLGGATKSAFLLRELADSTL
jgi:MGT family glycosyltransferase